MHGGVCLEGVKKVKKGVYGMDVIGMYICMHVHGMYVCMYVCMHVHGMYVCMYVCMYIFWELGKLRGTFRIL